MKEKTYSNNSLDPLRILSPELFDLIFQHLKPKDLMRKSFVSKLWHQEIGNSQNMNRINIFIYKNSQDDLNEALTILLRSHRGYKSVSINLGTFSFDDSLEKAAKVGQTSYRKVKYSDGEIGRSLWSIESIERTVETIVFSFMGCDLNFDANFTFPNLKHLTLYQNSKHVNLLFQNCTNLMTFDYSEKWQLDDECQFIENILMNNATLTALCLQMKNGSRSIKNTIMMCKFRLKKLTFSSYKLNDPMPTANRELLCEIIKMQMKCLEDLSLSQWCGSSALELIFQMPRLTNLTFNVNYGNENLINFELHTNLSIRRIDIDDVKENDLDILVKIIKSLPNLVVYKACIMQNHDMIMLERYCKNIKELYVENFLVDFVPCVKFFSNVVLFKSLDINNEIVMSILAKEDCKRSHFENLILAAGLHFLDINAMDVI